MLNVAEEEGLKPDDTFGIVDSHLIVICILSMMAAVIAVLGVFFCLRTSKKIFN